MRLTISLVFALWHFSFFAASDVSADDWLPQNQLRWRVPTVPDPSDQRLVSDTKEQLLRDRKSAITVHHALPVGDMVMMRTADHLLAVNFKNGKRIWEWPWYPTAGGKLPVRGMVIPRFLLLKERMWSDQTFAHISTDGKTVFVVNDPYSPSQTKKIGVAPFVVGRHIVPPSFNRLAALSLEREGAIVRQAGGIDSDDEPKLAKAFFLCAPVPSDKKLYVIADQQKKIRLFSLDPKTGTVKKTTELFEAKLGIRQEPIRRMSGAKPVVAKDVIICPTSTTKLFAVNADKQDVRWTYEYEDDFAGNRPRLRAPEIGFRWNEGQTIVRGERVVFTSLETAHLHCLDLKNGKTVWAPRYRKERLFFEVPDDDTIFIFRHDAIEAINLADGEDKWDDPLALKDPPSGRGFTIDGHYYLPTEGKEVLRIDLAKRKIVDRVKTDSPLGNLTTHNDDIISHGTDWLTTFPRRK